nr:hypothetical protein CFP56_19577 [Quercus suber]
MSETPPPAIAISRTSTESRESRKSGASDTKSNKQRVKAERSRPSLPHVDTTPDYRWYHRSNRHKASQQTPGSSKHAPEVEWHIKWDKDCFPNGRVLIIDYLSNDHSYNVTSTPGGRRHAAVVSQEFENLALLEKFYADSRRVHQAALRVIHVQNATWATTFLQKKFNINNPNELVGMPGFSKWVRFEKPRQRNGKPFPNGRSFSTQTDPWRSISRTAFGFDYLKTYQTAAPSRRRREPVFGERPIDAKVMHLNAYEDSRSPHGYDASMQRMSVYIQRNLGPPGRLSPDVDIKNPYAKPCLNGHQINAQDEKGVDLEDMDNTNTVIVFETSASMLLEDCLVQPRNQFESRWRRLSFYLKREEALNDSRLAAQCTNLILSDIFHGLTFMWEDFLSIATDHVNILEDKIYENPADESRAPELWVNQAAWLKVDKIMWIHQDLVKETQNHLRELADAYHEDDDRSENPSIEWLLSTPAEYERISHSIQEDLVQPTVNLNDLMYKSVGIRDSRQSLQLGLSMWRLSWITFIFLPLTFIVSIKDPQHNILAS